MDTGLTQDTGHRDHDTFFCGVIEGFYNRPWTRDQRLDLFGKMSKWGLNSYLYAPKDDSKHRSHWRELYTPAECKDLQELVTAASSQGVTFYYGISPGLDMQYSSQAEQDLLLAKTKQLQDLGCRGFAVLWDDIEPELTVEDAKFFTSFAEAHCAVTNKVHEALGRPPMLMCPVEYCSSRAVPNVARSSYLSTLGKSLNSSIAVFWTGSSVVSASITASECRDLAAIIKRRPVLWDNLHANDYDQGRVLLGPYIGREANPKEYLAGAMTNPNCEYTLNIPAILSLADWAGTSGHSWQPSGLSSQARAVTALLEESRRDGYNTTTTDCVVTPGQDTSGLTEQDWDLVCQFFWLPHSHGPRVEALLEEFAWCRDTCRAVLGWRDLEPGTQSETVDCWVERAGRVSSVSLQFSSICDQVTKIANRELLYDLIPYLTNVRVILTACSNYLKWVGLRHCSKPLHSGPTLAGLPGGAAGDLLRLYPVQSSSQFPLRRPPGPSHLTVLPATYTARLGKEIEAILGPEEHWQGAVMVAGADSILVVRQEGKVVGLLAAWHRDHLDRTETTGSTYSSLLSSGEGADAILRMWGQRDGLAWLLEPSLLLQVVESVAGGEGKSVMACVHSSQHALANLLRLIKFETCPTSTSLPGHVILWRRL